MKLISVIDANGFYVKPEFVEQGALLTDLQIETPCLNGFYRPKWNGTTWLEGLTQAEIDAIIAASIVPDVDNELAADIQAATTLEELKSALLGKNGIAKVKGRHV